MTLPLVTVIVPIYQVAELLPNALASLQSQTVREREYLLIDDGSLDTSAEVADNFAIYYDDFIVLHANNAGLSAARNRGLELSSGKYIGTIDSDDYVEPDMFEQMCNAAMEQEAELVLCGYAIQYEGQNGSILQPLELERKTPQQMTWPQYLMVSFANGTFGCFACMKVYAKSFLDGVKLRYPEGIALVEDNLYFLQLVHRLVHVAIISAPLYHYIRRSDSICGSCRTNGNELYVLSHHAHREALHRIFPVGSSLGNKLLQEARRHFLKTLTSEIKKVALKICSWREVKRSLHVTRKICVNEHLNDFTEMGLWEKALCAPCAYKSEMLCFFTMLIGSGYRFLRSIRHWIIK